MKQLINFKINVNEIIKINNLLNETIHNLLKEIIKNYEIKLTINNLF